MSFLLKDHVTSAGKPRNEDLFRMTQSQALLLDGSTDLGLYQNMPDAAWFVDRFAGAFLEQEACHPVEQRLCAAVDTVAQACLRQTGNDPRMTDRTPSASLMLVEEREDTLEFTALGDCSAVLYFRDGRQPVRFRDHRVDPFDGAVLAAMGEMAAQTGMDILSTVKTEPIREMLLQNRSKMNTPQGYWILAFCKEAFRHLHRLCVPREEVSQVLLFTDGFDAMAQAFLEAPPRQSLPALCRQLRDRELADKNCNRYPRFHTHDDACAALLTVE